jgi:hypothetical protein
MVRVMNVQSLESGVESSGAAPCPAGCAALLNAFAGEFRGCYIGNGIARQTP